MKFEAHLLGLNAKWYLLAAGILVLCYGLSHLARWHWTLDLLSHFQVQYAFFGLVFFAIFVVLKMPLVALVMLAVFAGAFYETRAPLSQSWQFSPPQRIETDRSRIRVLHYNKYYSNKRHDQITQFLKNNGEPFDVVFLMEVEPDDARILREALADTYPYSLPAEGIGPDFSLIFSLHELLSNEHRMVAPEHVRTRGTRFTIKPEGFDQPIALYTLHTRVPIAARGQFRRNAELSGMSQWIAADPSPYKILAGDFNITPYSPFFGDFVRDSGLTYQTYGVFPPGTWVSFFTLPFLKIPIDHMLAGPGMRLLELTPGPARGSDHNSLVGIFSVSP